MVMPVKRLQKPKSIIRWPKKLFLNKFSFGSLNLKSRKAVHFGLYVIRMICLQFAIFKSSLLRVRGGNHIFSNIVENQLVGPSDCPANYFFILQR